MLNNGKGARKYELTLSIFVVVMTFVDLVSPKGAVFVDCIMQCQFWLFSILMHGLLAEQLPAQMCLEVTKLHRLRKVSHVNKQNDTSKLKQ